MKNESQANSYMLLFRGTNWHQGLSPEEIQRVMGEWTSWFERLSSEGKIISARPLEKEGKFVSGKKGRVVADGPFAESKEAVGGFFMLNVDSMDAAVAIAKECPALEYGSVVEVRQVAAMCPASCEAAKLAEKELATA
jgi:hypothetical protein